MSGTAPQPPASASRQDRLPSPHDLLDPESEVVLDFVRGEYAAARGSVATVLPGAASPRPAQPEPADREPPSHDQLVYLAAASHCYAIVQYEAAGR